MKRSGMFTFTRQIISECSGIRFTLDKVMYLGCIDEVYLVTWHYDPREGWCNLDVSGADDFLPVYFGWKRTGREAVSNCGRVLDPEAVRYFLSEY